MKASTKEISETKEIAMSDILKSVHKTAKGLNKAGVIDKTTMRRFDTLCSITRRQNQSRAKANPEVQL
tara:strand:+ start:20310 stop:20513 length:204 start_codon:yes stop_codon:yes gene_type:complete